jgi:hypothetical protein
MTPEQKISKIIETAKSGKTVWIRSSWVAIKITKNLIKNWESSPTPLFKWDEKSMYVCRGKRYDCIDHCVITVES